MDAALKRLICVLHVVTGTLGIISGYAFDIVYVRDGDTVQLKCPVNPVDSWQDVDTRKIVAVCTNQETMIYHGDQSIAKKMFVTSKCHLGIYNFTGNDPKGFQCITPNDTHKIYISLIEPPTNMRIEHANEKGEVYGIAGKSITITCKVNSGIPKEKMTWTKNDELVSTGGPSELKYTFNVSLSDDNSNMTCSANNTAKNVIVTKQVTLRILKKPTVMLRAKPYSAIREGTTISLICEISLESKADTFSWKHNGVSLQGVLDNKLVIISTKKSDSGLYSCIASNKVGTSIANLTVIVNYAPIVKKAHIVFHLDEIIRNLHCEASGIPNEYTYDKWQHLTFDDKFIRYLHGSDNGTLLLPYHKNEDKRYQDSGIYVCTVSNNVLDTNGELWQTGRIHVTIKGRPVFANPNDTEIQFGYFNTASNIVINVLSYTAISNVTWFNKDNRIIQKDESCTLTMIQTKLFAEEVSTSGHRCTMTITNTKPDDFQNYTVKVDNEDGSNCFQFVLKSATVLILRIEAFPKSIVMEGDALTLICRLGDIPLRTKVKWKFNSSVLLRGGHLHEYNSIYFPSVNSGQTGNYSCEVDTELGSDKKTIFIWIQETKSKKASQSIVSFILIMVGVLVSFLLCGYIMKALKKKIMIHIQRNQTSMERSMRQESSERNNESHYDEIDSVCYGPIQIHDSIDNVVEIDTSALKLSAVQNDSYFVMSQNTNSVGKVCSISNEIKRLSQNSEIYSTKTQSQASDDSYLVPCTSYSDRILNETEKRQQKKAITDQVEISSISSNESETLLKSGNQYEPLRSVNINEHPYLDCNTLDPSQHQEDGL